MSNDQPDSAERDEGSAPVESAAPATVTPPEPTDESPSSSTLSNVIIGATTLLAIVSLFSVWARTQLLDTDEWVDLSVRLLEEPEVQDAIASELVGALYADDAVAQGLEEVLPTDLSGLAAPLAGVVREPLTDGVAALLSTEELQALWGDVNRVAHTRLVSVLRGEDFAGLSTSAGEIAIELRPLVISAGEAVGVPQERLDEIPSDAGRIVIFESEELDTVQQAVDILETLAWFLFVLVVVLYALAVFLAPGTRLDALRNVGLSIFVVGVIVLVAQAIAKRTLVGIIADDPSAEPVTDAALTVGTALLRQQGWSAAIYGLLIAAFAILLGSRSRAIRLRHWMAPAFTASTGAVVAGTVIGLLLLFWWSPGRAFNGWTTGLLLVALVIGAVVALRRQLQRELAGPPTSDAAAAVDASAAVDA